MVVIFAKKQEKISLKKIFSKRSNLKKRKNPGDGSYIRNKLCIKNSVFHVYALNKGLAYFPFTCELKIA